MVFQCPTSPLTLRIFCTGVDPVAIEILADEAIGVEAVKERTLLESRLGGTRNNRVFVFFEIEAPQRAADARLAEAKEKKKAKGEPSGAAGGKRKKTSKGGGTGALEKKKHKTEGGGRFPRSALALSMMCSCSPLFIVRGILRTGLSRAGTARRQREILLLR